jgi:hypothetical protein
MAYSFPEIRKFQGLFLQANTFEVPDGAMEEARNVVIKNDDTLSKVRGHYTYFDTGVLTANQLFFYRERLLAAFSAKVSYFTDTGTSPNETGTATDLTGETVSITGTRVSRSVEANNNLYFTTDNGVLKLEDYNSSIYKSGVPQGLDLGLKLLNTSVGVIPVHSSVSYRVLFGRRDSNNNLLLSAPSNISTIYTGAAATAAAYTSSGAGPYTVTVTQASHGLITGQEIIVSGTSPADPDAEGTFTITVTGTNTFTYSTVNNPGGPGTLNYTFTRNVRLEFTVPSEISSSSDNYFVQVYRSSEVSGNNTPALDFKLVTERTLTSTEITNHVGFFDDDVDELLLGAELYTNPNSREGELQANFRAPKCEDVAFYKNYVFYANCESRKLLYLDSVDPSALASGDYVEFRSGSVTRRYVALTGIGNSTVNSQSISSAAGDLQVNYTSHGFSNGDSIYISSVTGGSLVTGTYFIVSAAANSFEISSTFGGASIAFNSETAIEFQGVIRPTSVAGVNWSRASGTVTVTSPAHDLQTGMTIAVTASAGGAPNVTLANYVVTVTGVNTFTFTENVANSSGTLDYRVNNYMFQLDNSSSSIATQLRLTAQGIVKAVNRDTSSLLYANYTSTTIPGQMRFIAKGFIDTVYSRANDSTTGSAFLPVLPSSYSSGTQVSSTNDDEDNVAYVSKLNEPEAVPLLNKFPMGSRTKAILRVVALRDSVIFVKEDGIFRLTGETVDSFSITVLDSTVICVATSSVKLLNNEVILLSNQGVCRISESAVQIVSRRIDDVIQPILGKSTLEAQTSAVAYESERLYFLTTVMPNSTEADETYLYNVLNGSWTQGELLIKEGIIGPNDTMYFISTLGDIEKERKNQTKIDFSGQNYSATVVSVASDLLSAVITSSSVTPEKGDMLVLDDIITRFLTVTPVSGSNYTVTFGTQTNLEASDTPTLYKRIVSDVKFSPFHAGEVGRMKQFGQIQYHSRNDSISRLYLSFISYLFGGSGLVEWTKADVVGTDALGWGNEPWGLFPWGLTETINTIIGTQPEVPIRIYIPIYQQRASWIQSEFTHSEAGEAINLQAVSYAIRPYQERVVR